MAGTEMTSQRYAAKVRTDVARFRDLYVRHPRAEATEEQLVRSIERAADDNHLTHVIGPTGVGKTRMLNHLLERFDDEAGRDPSPDRVGAVRVRLEPHGGAYHPARLDRLILAALDEPLVDRKTILPADGAAHLGFRGTNEARRRAVLNALRIRRPSVLAFDEAQHFGYLSGHGIKQALDDLKTIVDNSSVPLLFCGGYELASFGGLSAQLTRRSEEVHFSRYTGNRDDWRDFLTIVAFVATKAPFDFDPLGDDDGRRLYAGSIGSVGLLMSWAARALERALSAGRSSVTRADLEAAAWPDGKLKLMLEDAQLGEGAMRKIAGDRDGLYEALGLIQKGAPKRSGNRRPGQRKATRDPVAGGTASSDAATA